MSNLSDSIIDMNTDKTLDVTKLDSKAQDLYNNIKWKLQDLTKEKQKVETKVDSFEAKENLYDIWGKNIDMDVIVQRLLKQYIGKDELNILQQDPNDVPGISTSMDQSNQAPKRTIDRTPSGFIISHDDQDLNYPLDIEITNFKFDVTNFDKKIDVIINELVPPEISTERDRVLTELRTSEQMLAEALAQLAIKENEISSLNDALDRLAPVDQDEPQIYPDGTFLTVPEVTDVYVVYKAKRRFVPSLILTGAPFSIDNFYKVSIPAGSSSQSKTLLDTLLASYNQSVRTVNIDEILQMEEGYVIEYSVNPQTDTAEIILPAGDPSRVDLPPPAPAIDATVQQQQMSAANLQELTNQKDAAVIKVNQYINSIAIRKTYIKNGISGANGLSSNNKDKGYNKIDSEDIAGFIAFADDKSTNQIYNRSSSEFERLYTNLPKFFPYLNTLTSYIKSRKAYQDKVATLTNQINALQ
jgi:hypothetical protein